MNILVIGDTCTDVFIYGTCDRICPEGPVPIFKPINKVENKGMAGNVYQNLLSLNIDNVDIITNHETITKTRYVEEKSNHLIVRVDENDIVENSFNIHNVDFEKYDAVVVADYDKGFLTVNNLMNISRSHDLTFLDTKKILGKWADNFTFIKINELEWTNCEKAGLDYSYWKEKLIITKSSKGCLYNGFIYPVESNLDVRDISGAGDTFMAAFACSYVKTLDMSVSLRFANKCASTVIQKRGVSTL
jgi:D-beta-D-heptose 7-phosphate kinase/D-beta-D-heptose 1-phosphate adenosyltransferase